MKQEDQKFKIILGYIVLLRLHKKAEEVNTLEEQGKSPDLVHRRCEHHPVGSAIAVLILPDRQRPQHDARLQNQPVAQVVPARIWAGGQT